MYVATIKLVDTCDVMYHIHIIRWLSHHFKHTLVHFTACSVSLAIKESTSLSGVGWWRCTHLTRDIPRISEDIGVGVTWEELPRTSRHLCTTLLRDQRCLLTEASKIYAVVLWENTADGAQMSWHV